MKVFKVKKPWSPLIKVGDTLIYGGDELASELASNSGYVMIQHVRLNKPISFYTSDIELYLEEL